MFFVWLLKQAGFHAAIAIASGVAVAISSDPTLRAFGMLATIFFASVAGYLWCGEGWIRRKKLWTIPDELASRWLDELCFSDSWQRLAACHQNQELTERTFETIQRAMELALRAEANRLGWERTHKEIEGLLGKLKERASRPKPGPES